MISTKESREYKRICYDFHKRVVEIQENPMLQCAKAPEVLLEGVIEASRCKNKIWGKELHNIIQHKHLCGNTGTTWCKGMILVFIYITTAIVDMPIP